jgi:hypothetical protein
MTFPLFRPEPVDALVSAMILPARELDGKSTRRIDTASGRAKGEKEGTRRKSPAP